MSEYIAEKEYQLLMECEYINNGDIAKTKNIVMFDMHLENGDQAVKLFSDKLPFVNFLAEKGYITPAEKRGAKLKVNKLSYRAAILLAEEYAANFLDISPFLPKA